MTKRQAKKSNPFPKILTALMTERKIGIREAALLAGVGPSTLMSWRAGSTPGDYLAVRRLAQGLGTSLSFLLTGEDEGSATRPPQALTEFFDEVHTVFDGFARIRIDRLIPRQQLKKDEET